MPDRTPGSSDESVTGHERTDLEARVRALEAQVQRLTSLVGNTAAPAAPADPADPAAQASGQPATSRRASEQAAASLPPSDRDAFWALTALQDRLPPPGGVVFAGSVTTDAGHVQFQWGRPTGDILEADWAERAETVGALGHPLRLALLRQLVDGERTVAHLVDELDLGSTGVAYHHLNALQSGGWATSPRRGTWAVPPTRVIPLLTILIALENG